MVSVDDFKTRMEAKIDDVCTNHDVLHVLRSEGGSFVVVPEDDWKAIEETIYLNQIPGLVASIHRAAKESVEDGISMENLEW
jgi:PHD/YefM family antitoxin component YafN of YafNO toxin-antitoxin module